jgi:CBS domain-containing protein
MSCAVMEAPVIWSAPNDTVAQCARLMAARNVGFIPVLDATGRPKGVVTDRDLAIRVVAEGRSSHTPLREVMTREVVSCRAADPIQVAEETMAATRRSRLLVLDQTGRCLGVLSLSDVAKAENRARSGRLLAAVTCERTFRRDVGPVRTEERS